MKIITWNCNGAFRKKFDQIDKLNADILIIQECEDPGKSTNKEYLKWATNYLWHGKNKNKGLGIFAKDAIKIVDNSWETKERKYFISAKVNNDFDLIAVWNHHANSPNFRYIGQFWKYLQENKSLMSNTIIAGDFNSNKIWDEWDRWWNHSDVVRELEEIGIRSLYHVFKKELQGEEKTPTFYMHRKNEKPYHIDYAFASNPIVKKIRKLEIGNYSDWIEFSDHMPLIFELSLINE